MITAQKSSKFYSTLCSRALILSIFMTVVLSIFDALARGEHEVIAGRTITILITDFRYLFEQGIYASSILFIGAKFFERQMTLTIGFDKLGAEDMVYKGPDADNIVWIGRRYKTPLEAQAVATMVERHISDGTNT